MKDVANTIVERINREVGSDLKSLHKCRIIVDEYKDRINNLEEKVQKHFCTKLFLFSYTFFHNKFFSY